MAREWLGSIGEEIPLKSFFQHPFFPLALSFLLLNLVVTQDGGQNAKSRILAMRSFVESGSPNLNDQLGATDDWALSPNGNYYSNKAPGPILLGLPVFFLFDSLHRIVEQKPAPGEPRSNPGYMQFTATSFVMQVLPYALLVLWACTWLGKNSVGFQGQMFFALAALFGNTSSLFMNSYFGHGFEALLQLGALLFLLEGNFLWSGCFFSFSLLSDYGFAVQIPALLFSLAILRPKKKDVLFFSAGAIPGAILWVAYHGILFGSPFGVASRFQNPTFLEANQDLLLGAISLPSASILWELLFGACRGLWLQQPWIFAVVGLPFVFRKISEERNPVLLLSTYCVTSLAALLLMNSAYNGWHGGGSAGPRYLAGVLPCFALLLAFVFERGSGAFRLGLWGALGLGLLFRAFVYAGTLLAPNLPLWSFYFAEIASRPTAQLRLGIFSLSLVLGIWATLRRQKMMQNS